MKKNIFLIFFLFSYALFAQEVPLSKENQKTILEKKKLTEKAQKSDFEESKWKPIPLKAALFSSILPGLGQLYNRRYWKASLVVGALAGGISLSLYQRNIYKKHHLSYVAAVNGTHGSNAYNLSVNDYYEIQDSAKRYYNYTFLFTIIVYVLNIMDAFVDAHLDEIRKDKELNKLSLSPTIIPDFNNNKFAFALSLNFKF